MIYRILITALLLTLPLAAESLAAEYLINGTPSQYDIAPAPDIDRKSITPYNDNFDWYTDNAHGYRLLVPKNSTVDISMSTFRTVLKNNNLTVEIYYDDLTNNTASFSDLVHYSNNFLYRGGLHYVSANYNTTVNGYSAHTTKWQRDKLARLPDDKNFYMATSIKRTSQKIYTILLKSQTPLGNTGETITNNFSFITPSGTTRNYKQYHNSTTKMNPATQEAYQQLFGKNKTLTWGIFENSAPQVFHRLEEKEAVLGHRFKVLLRYQTIDEQLPLAQLNRAWENDRIVELTLATIHNTEANALWINGVPPNASVAYEILDGKYDDYLTNYAKNLKEFGKPILFRLNNEMNGDWCWYSAFYTGRDTDIYKQLWLYIRNIFDREEVDNLIWVWNPHDISLPDFAWNNFMSYYPGDQYVDVIGLTGYNNGTYFAGEKWRTFDQIYSGIYHQYTQLFDKPFIITEFSSNSVGGDKAAWINDMFKNIEKFPNIKVAVWWNGVDYDQAGNPGRIYLIDDSPEVVSAMQQGLANYKSLVKAKPPQEDPEKELPILRRGSANPSRP